jgi:hypothetical protein
MGFLQDGAQAEPHGLKNSLAGHFGVSMATGVSVLHALAGTHSPYSSRKKPGWQKQPITHCFVQIGLGMGFLQDGAQAEPHGLKNSLAGHFGVSILRFSRGVSCATQCSAGTQRPKLFLK